MHFLALEQLAGGDGLDDSSLPGSFDWLAHSERFSALDNELGVGSLAAELLTSPDAPLEVSFASGGQLVRGAAVAAAALYSGREIVRIDANDRVLDRSFDALDTAGFSIVERFALLATWIRLEPTAAVVVIDLDAPGADDACHELICRYPVLASTLDYVDADDAVELSFARSASVRTVFLAASGPVFAQVVAHHQDAIVLVRRGADAQPIVRSLASPRRPTTTSSSHEQRLRKLRRANRRQQLVDLARGR